MMRRRPMRRGPGLVGMAARTAVVAGTATAVAGHVHEKQYEKQEAKAEAAQAQAAQAAPPPPDPAPAPPAAAPAAGGGEESLLDQIERLGKLHSQGLLTDDEFSSMKAKLLA
jgi:hypothetical protein